MRRLVVLALIVLAALCFAFHDTVVQVYTKIFVDLELVEETRRETYLNGQLIEKKVDTRYVKKDSLELWIAGSGFIIWSGDTPDGKKTLLMTNYHVIEYCITGFTEFKMDDAAVLVLKRNSNGKLEPFTPSKEQFYRLVVKRVEGPFLIFYKSWKRNQKQTYEVKAQIEKYDALLDVAVMSLPNVHGLPKVELAESVDDYALGEQITIFGAPLGIPFQVTRGVLGQKHLDVDYGWMDLLRYDCPQAPGSSGSAIFASDGKVIGIVRGSFVNLLGAAYDGQHLGISVDNIRDWLFFNGYQFIFEGGVSQ